MNHDPPLLSVKLWSEYACFTRPEQKAERTSYPVMTPSAARGALEAIFWHPQFSWRVREIHVLRPIRYVGLVRNEVNVKASGAQAEPISITDNRTQRHTLALHTPAYVVKADIVLKPDVTDDVAKFRAQFRRRVERGQAFSRPFLGAREFAAHFSPPDPGEHPIDRTEDLGLMLFDILYGRTDERGRQIEPNVPLFFPATLEKGVLHVPGQQYERGRPRA